MIIFLGMFYPQPLSSEPKKGDSRTLTQDSEAGKAVPFCTPASPRVEDVEKKPSPASNLVVSH